MNKRILALAGAAALTVPLAACSSGPPSASSVLQGDGYSHIVNQSGLAAFSGSLSQRDRRDITSYAVGYKPGGQVEMVVIVTQTGAAQITPAQLAGDHHGVHVSLSGDVLRLTGTVSEFSQLP